MHITGSFPNFFDTTMLPAITGAIWQAFDAKPKQAMKLLRVETTTKKIIQKAGVTGVGLPTFVEEGADTDTDTMMQLPPKTYRMLKYGLGIGASRELVADDEHGIISRRAEILGESIAEGLEIQGFSVVNNGFDATNYPGPDGKALFSLTHPAYKAGGVRSNLLAVAADLDQDSLELALIDYENMTDHRGFFQVNPNPVLLVAPQNRFTAYEITKSDQRSDTGNNAINALKYAETGPLNVMVSPYLTDPDAWFLIAPKKNDLLWVWREKPYTARDYWEKSETGVVYVRYRADFGFSTERGTYGTPGA
jgi:hypothetical protein